MTDPTRIHIERVEAALRMLGIDRFTDVLDARVNYKRVEIHRLRRDAAGRIFPAGEEIATEHVTIGVIGRHCTCQQIDIGTIAQPNKTTRGETDPWCPVHGDAHREQVAS